AYLTASLLLRLIDAGLLFGLALGFFRLSALLGALRGLLLVIILAFDAARFEVLEAAAGASAHAIDAVRLLLDEYRLALFVFSVRVNRDPASAGRRGLEKFRAGHAVTVGVVAHQPHHKQNSIAATAVNRVQGASQAPIIASRQPR